MQTLTDAFQKQFNIAKILNSFTGGQKTVWIIEDSSGKKMAMKSFTYCNARDLQEMEILKRFNSSPGIPKIIKIEDYQGKPLLFEEYIDAPDLQDIIVNYNNDSPKVIELIKDIATILKPIWEARIVHRDLKPKNIKILSDGKPVILDFGIARDLNAESITNTGDDQPMTWDYASPEQYKKDKSSINYRTDFFCVGLIMYRLYYQQHPFGNTKAEVENKFAIGDNSIFLKPNDSLNNFFKATLNIDPSSRPRSVDLLLSTL